MTMRLIDADKVMQDIEKLQDSAWYKDDFGSVAKIARVDAVVTIRDSVIKAAPTVDPIKHGRWDDSFDGITPYCSVCKRSHRCFKREPDYCPNCGAKMDEVKDV